MNQMADTNTFNWSNFLLGTDEKPGALGVGADLLGTGANMLMGMKSLGLMEDRFDLSNLTTRANYTNNAKAFNLNLADRYALMEDRARTNSAAAKQGIMSRDEFMRKYSVKEEL